MARSRPIVVKTTVVLKLNSLVRPRHRRRFRGFGPCCRWVAGGGRLGCGQVNKLQVSLPSCGDRKPPRARAAFRVDPVALERSSSCLWTKICASNAASPATGRQNAATTLLILRLSFSLISLSLLRLMRRMMICFTPSWS